MKLVSILLLSTFVLITATQSVKAQISIANTSTVSENFDGIGTAATASLPANWKMSPAGTGSPTWSDVNNVTATAFAASGGSPITGGRYNWGKSTGTDRSIGFISSVNYLSPNSVMAWFQNVNTDYITSLTISYDLYQFRINT